MTKFVKSMEASTHSEAETLAWAETFAKSLSKGDVIALYGTLGAGKTVISRGICKGLGFASTRIRPCPYSTWISTGSLPMRTWAK